MKHKFFPLMITVGLIMLTATLFNVRAQNIPAIQKHIYEARDKVLPALVHVEPIKKVYSTGEKQRTLVTGSGVIFSPEGYVITNHHVAENAEKVWCTLYSKERITATVVGSDASTDIAVLKLNLDELKNTDLTFAKLGNSDSVEVGQIVLALGSPLGLSRSVSMGVISSIDRYFPDRGNMISPYNLWIQTDAAINPGNSGGPLINLNGEVIGINARGVFLAENLGFAIPINLVKEIAQKIISGANITRSWIGIEFQSLKDYKEYARNPDLKGVLVSHVEKNSPAQKAGFQAGDILLKIDGKSLHAEFDEDLPIVRKIIADLPIGEKVKAEILRNGKIKKLTVKTIPEPLRQEPEFEAKKWGLVVKNLSWNAYRFQNLPDFKGVSVESTKPGSLADAAGIQEGDIILSLNQQIVENRQSFIEMYNKWLQSSPQPVFIEIMRNGHPYYAVLKPQSF